MNCLTNAHKLEAFAEGKEQPSVINCSADNPQRDIHIRFNSRVQCHFTESLNWGKVSNILANFPFQYVD